jgi:predicted ATPase
MGDGATTSTVELLERSAQLDALDGHRVAVGEQGRGRLVLIAGEAGIGKTALVRAFCARAAQGRVLWGACDALFTPRPLGPFVDIADEVGGELGAAVAEGAAAGALVGALTRSLRTRPPDIVVLEDLHWADEATLDVLRLLARRIEGSPRWCSSPIATTSSMRATRCGSSSASCPAARRRDWRCRRSPPRGWPSWRARSVSTRPSCIAGPPATRST